MSKQQKGGSVKEGGGDRRSGAELVERNKLDNLDYVTSQKESHQNLIALAYKTKAANSSFRETPKVTFPTDSKKSGKGSILTGSSFFKKICDNVFDTIDVDRSGKINESELYQGLLLIHLKLGMYFGPAACNPISLDRTKFIFNKLDTNRDGSLDKQEFQKVLALLMGNVLSRILFQFVCTILIVPFLANTILENIMEGYGILTGSMLPVFREKYQPLLVVALGVDLMTEYALTAFATTSYAVQRTGISNLVSNITEVPAQFVAEKYDAFVLKPIGEIEQEMWESLPLTLLSTILALIIVPYSIVKTDDLFRYLVKSSAKT